MNKWWVLPIILNCGLNVGRANNLISDNTPMCCKCDHFFLLCYELCDALAPKKILCDACKLVLYRFN